MIWFDLKWFDLTMIWEGGDLIWFDDDFKGGDLIWFDVNESGRHDLILIFKSNQIMTVWISTYQNSPITFATELRFSWFRYRWRDLDETNQTVPESPRMVPCRESYGPLLYYYFAVRVHNYAEIWFDFQIKSWFPLKKQIEFRHNFVPDPPK